MSVFKPILYEKETTSFTNNGLGVLSEGQDGRCTEKLNGGYEVEFNYPISGINAENIAINRIVYAKPNRYDNPEPFRIYNITRSSSNFIKVNAEHKSYELSGYPCLPNDAYIENAGSCSTFMAYLQSECARTAAALGLPAYTFETDITATAQWTIENITDIKSAMALAVQYFGGEWKYTGTTCRLQQRRGQDRGVKVQYGSNMQSISQTEIDTSFSHIMPYWTDGTDTVYVDGNYVAATAQGTPLRKQVLVVNLTTECDAAYAGTDGETTKPTPAQLLTVAQNWLADNPPTPQEKNQRVKFIPRGQTIEYAYLGDIDHVELGDTIETANNPLNISTSQRCISLIYDFYRDIYIDAELGTPKASLTTVTAKEATRRETTVWVSVAEPTKDYQSGDYWIKIDNETNRKAQALARYTGGKWLLLCEFSAGSSGGVGEALDNHSERFNDYENNTAENSSNCHIEGTGNTVKWSYTVSVSGQNNTSQGCGRCLISGDGNTVSGAYYTVVGGYQNNVYSSYSAIFGDSNLAANGTYNLVSGSQNNVQVAHSIVGGYNNKLLSGGDYSILGGNSNTVGGSYASLVAGQFNTANGMSNGILAGTGNTSSGAYSLTVGHGNVNSGTDSIMCGEYGSGSYVIAVGNGTQGAPSLAFYVRIDGNVYTAGSYNTIGADYAEFFEWADGNPDNEDRRGMLVSLDGDRIVPAHGDDILGVVSANPSVIGNSCAEHWTGKYKKDVFGTEILGENGKRILSDDYDRDTEYIPRSERPEWDAVGLVGRLIVTDNGKCTPNGYVSARNGYAVPTLSKTNIRVLKRIDEMHIEILLK